MPSSFEGIWIFITADGASTVFSEDEACFFFGVLALVFFTFVADTGFLTGVTRVVVVFVVVDRFATRGSDGDALVLWADRFRRCCCIWVLSR